MNCPICHNSDSFVVRTDQEESAIKRRRQCCRCGHRWNTYETTADVSAELAQLKAVLRPVADLVR